MEWAQSQYDEFNSIYKPFNSNLMVHSKHLGVNVYKNSADAGTIKCFIYNERTNKTGAASVKEKNWRDPIMVVTALAWANYKGEEIPDFKVFLYNLSTNDRFYYLGQKYIYLTSNPYAENQILVCNMKGKPYNLSCDTRVSLEPR